MSREDEDTPAFGTEEMQAHRRRNADNPPPPDWDDLRESARAAVALERERQEQAAAEPKPRKSWRPNGGTKMVIGIVLSALVTVALVEGVPALISSDKEGAVKDAVQDAQLDQLRKGQGQIKKTQESQGKALRVLLRETGNNPDEVMK